MGSAKKLPSVRIGDGNNRFKMYGESVSDFEWVHLVATWNNGLLRLYQNGMIVNESYTQLEIKYGQEDIMIGNNYWLDHGFMGKIDNVRIYERVLSQGEIRDLYKSRK
jgi:hypothetical protein